MNIIITTLVIFVVGYFILIKYGNLSFWKRASKNPDFVYKKLIEDDAWVVDNGIAKINKENLDGPFFLTVPSVGRTIKFYGKVGKYEDSQKRIEKLFKSQTLLELQKNRKLSSVGEKALREYAQKIGLPEKKN